MPIICSTAGRTLPLAITATGDTPAPGQAVDVAGSYARYFSSGYYDQRYPRPNLRSLRTVTTHAQGARAILDFGCGDGRYLFPLLQLTDARIFACDVCSDALTSIDRCLSTDADRARVTSVLYPRCDMTNGQTVDLAIMMFGVLAHVPGRAERIAILRTVRERLEPGGRLIVSVPNGLRRFRADRRRHSRLIDAGHAAAPAIEHGDVLYERRHDGERMRLYYHLFTADELLCHLAEAGFARSTLTAESILPESVVTRSDWGRRIDGLLHRLTPTRLGYGLLAVACR